MTYLSCAYLSTAAQYATALLCCEHWADLHAQSSALHIYMHCCPLLLPSSLQACSPAACALALQVRLQSQTATGPPLLVLLSYTHVCSAHSRWTCTFSTTSQTAYPAAAAAAAATAAAAAAAVNSTAMHKLGTRCADVCHLC